MKKTLLTSITLLSFTTLMACSSNSKNNETTPIETSIDTTEKIIIDNSKYDEVVKEIKKTLDPVANGDITVQIENNIIDSDFPDGHDNILILLTGTSKNTAKEALDAVYSNNPTTDQSNTITLLRMTVSEIAKKLPEETTSISLGYEIVSNQFEMIAKSTKNKDIIPIDYLIME